MVGQPIGLGDMLEQVAAERCPGVKRPEADHVVVISQIGLNIDPEQFSLIDMDDLDPAGAQGAEQLILDPRLHDRAEIGRAAAEVEHRRQPLRREKIHHAAEPAGLGFEHRGLARPSKNAPRCPKPESLGKSGPTSWQSRAWRTTLDRGRRASANCGSAVALAVLVARQKRRNPGVASPPDQSLKTARRRASGDLLGNFPDTPSFPAFGACRFPARCVPEWPVQVP
jgi:hypothetical protein